MYIFCFPFNYFFYQQNLSNLPIDEHQSKSNQVNMLNKKILNNQQSTCKKKIKIRNKKKREKELDQVKEAIV